MTEFSPKPPGYAAMRRLSYGALTLIRICHAKSGVRGQWPAAPARPFRRAISSPPGALEQIQIGASQDQVLIVMGTPSTVATLNGEVFYYISQRAERKGRLHAAEASSISA